MLRHRGCHVQVDDGIRRQHDEGVLERWPGALDGAGRAKEFALQNVLDVHPPTMSGAEVCLDALTLLVQTHEDIAQFVPGEQFNCERCNRSVGDGQHRRRYALCKRTQWAVLVGGYDDCLHVYTHSALVIALVLALRCRASLSRFAVALRYRAPLSRSAIALRYRAPTWWPV